MFFFKFSYIQYNIIRIPLKWFGIPFILSKFYYIQYNIIKIPLKWFGIPFILSKFFATVLQKNVKYWRF